MFARLFAEAGLSLDRLRALVEVGAAGSIVKAADGDPVKQSQVSRQIKELEDFFQTRLVERHGKGIRLTAPGRELARISRFFLLGLSNFQRGCLSGEQTFRIGASATFLQEFLLPVLGSAGQKTPLIRFAVETMGDDETERRLHDLTLDFGIVGRPSLSRPLQLKALGSWPLQLWVPENKEGRRRKAEDLSKQGKVPLAVAAREFRFPEGSLGWCSKNLLECETFLQVASLLNGGTHAALLPEFLTPESGARVSAILFPELADASCDYLLAWNPRLLRLNPHATRRRDWLAEQLTARMRARATRGGGNC